MRFLHRHHHKMIEVGRERLYQSNDPNNYGKLVGVRGMFFNAPTAVTVITYRCADQQCKRWKQEVLKGWLPGATSPTDCVSIK